MAVIEFRMLGTLDLRRTDGHELHSLLAQPKRVALLAYLCLANPRGFHRRDTLLGLFWPDADQAHARTSLRNALHVLRRALGDDALQSRGDEEVAVNFDKLWCDALEFEKCLGSTRADEALELYRGDLLTGFFLEDVAAFERWLEGERIRLRGCAAQAARVAGEQHEAERNLTGAVRCARRAVELTDNDERAFRRLVELLVRAGDRAGALEAYETFVRHLAAEFQAEPSSETRILLERIRDHDAAARIQGALHTPGAVNQPSSPELIVPGYTIERELGRGGMATVFLARDLKHDRPVAIKILRADIAALLGTDRFLAEIAIASSLHHPHILPLLDSGKANGLPYYVMPHTDGETLRARLQRERILSVEEAIKITCDVADGLGYAHAHGIVHRDIKPENILLENGHALVMDFGIARAISQAGSQRLTEAGIAVGTPAYISPEQAEPSGAVDARTDIYALACVLYEMLTGDPPFPGSSARAILARKAAEPAPRLRSVRETIPPRLERNVLKALSRVPADRFKTVTEFASSLDTARPASSWSISRTAVARALIGAAAIVTVVFALFLAREKLYGPGNSRVVLADRRLITSTGHISYPAISPDGKTLAYLLMQCRTKGCTYAIELQEIDGSASRQLLDSVSELTRVGLEWSPDRRNILAYGRIKGQQGTFLISTLGGAARHIGPSLFAFWADGDSLLTYRRGTGGFYWIFVSGLDGVPRDSFPINAQADGLTRLVPVPNSPWIIGLARGPGLQWVSFDRTGRIIGKLPPRSGSAPPPRASTDALWIGAQAPGSNLRSVVRIPFDARTGLFGSREDTLYSGHVTSIGVPADGKTFVVDEGTPQFTLWALDFQDAIRGVFPEKGRLLTATSDLANELSPDGRKLLVGRPSGSTVSGGTQWEVLPFEGGQPTPIAGTPASDFWADSVTLTLKTQTSRGIELSLLDINTGARRASYAVPDSAMGEFVSLRGEGWAWTAIEGMRVHRPGEGVRTYPIPGWYDQVGQMTASPDGKRVVFVGRGANEDSARVSVMSLADGVVTPLTTLFGGAVWPELLADGSVILAVWETGDWVSIRHVRSSGETDWIRNIPRPVWAFSISANMRRAAISVRDYRADAVLSHVVRH